MHRTYSSLLSLLLAGSLSWLGCSQSTRVGEDADGGAGGDGGGPGTDGGTGSVTPEQILRAGVVWGSCVPDDGIADFIEDYWAREYELEGFREEEAIACLAASESGCDVVETCTGVAVSNDGPCTPSCDGNVFSACDDALHFRMDCGRYGLVCNAAEGCVSPDATPCDFDTFTTSCADGRPTFCSGVVQEGPRCADYGLTCDVDPGGTDYACVGTGGSCTSTSWGPLGITYEGIACDGEVLEACVAGGSHRTDCAALGPGFGCHQATDPETGSAVFYCGLGSDCVASREITCEGSSVVLCNMGRREVFDCTELGFTGCAEPFGCIPNAFSI